MSNNATKTPLLVKKSDSKKGSLWHDYANRRIIKQHGGFDIPDDDLHAVHKYVSPLQGSQTTPEENNAVLSDIEKQIQALKEKDNKSFTPSKPPDDFQEFLNTKQPNNTEENDDLG